MKFTTGAMVGDLSGSIGSTTASRNRFGPYFRNKVIPVNPNTVRQQTVRSLFATLVSTWNDTLSEAERIAWDTWADNTTIQGKDGNPINITGQNAYIRFNVPRLQIGGVRVDAAPVIFNNGNPVTSFQTTVLATDLTIGTLAGVVSTDVVVAGNASTDGDLAIYLGAPVNVSRAFFKGPYQLADVIVVANGDNFIDWATSEAALTQAVALAVGQFRSVRFRLIYDDGRLSEKFEMLADVIDDAI